MATYAYAELPGDDPERTEPIPRIGGYGEPGLRPEPPGPTPDISDFDGLSRRGRRRRKRPLWKELLTLAAVALLLTFLIQQFLGRVYLIPSGSMEKTLHGCPGCSNDRVLVDKLTYAFTDPQQGDVVVFEGPSNWKDLEYEESQSGNFVTSTLQGIGALVGLAPPNESDFVKRVIAVGGQTVQCCDDKGRVLVDGRPLDEPYVYWKNGKPDSRQRFDPVLVPKNAVWVMGDNRNNSCDSRCQGGGGIRGVVPIDNVIGKARFVVLPLSRWQGIGDHDPLAAAAAIGAPSWQQGLPAGVGFVAAWPLLWLSRRVRSAIRPPRATNDDRPE